MPAQAMTTTPISALYKSLCVTIASCKSHTALFTSLKMRAMLST